MTGQWTLGFHIADGQPGWACTARRAASRWSEGLSGWANPAGLSRTTAAQRHPRTGRGREHSGLVRAGRCPAEPREGSLGRCRRSVRTSGRPSRRVSAFDAIARTGRQAVLGGEMVHVVEVGRCQHDRSGLAGQGLVQSIHRPASGSASRCVTAPHVRLRPSGHSSHPDLVGPGRALWSHRVAGGGGGCGAAERLARAGWSRTIWKVPDGHCVSWWNPLHPGYPYPEISGLLLQLLADIDAAPTRRRELAAALLADLDAGQGIRRGEHAYTFDTAMAVRGLLADGHQNERTEDGRAVVDHRGRAAQSGCRWPVSWACDRGDALVDVLRGAPGQDLWGPPDRSRRLGSGPRRRRRYPSLRRRGPRGAGR